MYQYDQYNVITCTSVLYCCEKRAQLLDRSAKLESSESRTVSLEEELRGVRERLRGAALDAEELTARLASASDQVAALTADKEQLLARIDSLNVQHSTMCALLSSVSPLFSSFTCFRLVLFLINFSQYV